MSNIKTLVQSGPAPARRVAALVDVNFCEVHEARRLRWEWPAIATALGVPAHRWKSVAAAYRRCSQKRKEQAQEDASHA